MKHLIIILFLIMACSAFAQFSDSTSAVIDSNATNSAAVDLGSDKLLSITFPATVTSDTVFIQHRRTATGAWADVYYTQSTGTRIRAHILVQASATVSVPPLWATVLRRYVRIVADDAEGDERTLGIDKGKF